MKMRKPRTKVGHIGYAKIIACLPGTVEDIATKVDRRRCEIARIMRELMVLRIVHRPRFVPRGSKNSAASWWELGAGHNAVCGNTPDIIQPRAKVIAFASIVRALEQPSTISELVQATGVDHLWIRNLVRGMHEDRLVRVAGWTVRRCTVAAEYVLGAGKDAPRPARKPRKAVNQDYVRRKTALRDQARINRALAGVAYESVVDAVRHAPETATDTWLADRYGVHHSTVRRIRARSAESRA